MGKHHPYRTGNYAPAAGQETEGGRPQPCASYHGRIPFYLSGGMYLRNGSNPAATATATATMGGGSEDHHDYHWFDGDGLLAGVLFHPPAAVSPPPPPCTQDDDTATASFIHRYVLTDILLASSPSISPPLLPSIATLLAPLSHLHTLLYSIARATVLTAASHLLPRSSFPIHRISVANTAVMYHDGRALATCESGPPMWIHLPALDTVGWWDLQGDDEGEIGLRELGGSYLGWMKEWCTAHPKRDPQTQELILFHSSLLPPYLHYSVIPSSNHALNTPRILHEPVPIPSSRMMHDCGASHKYTILLDLPLSLSPLNLLRGTPVVAFSPTTPSRFGVLPRHTPSKVIWYTAPSCVIFHTALTYDTATAVHLLCCQLNSSTLVYAAGNMTVPHSQRLPLNQEETCRLTYYRFPLDPPPLAIPSHCFSLSTVPFEFPCVPFQQTMKEARFIYGCTMRNGSFTAALGSAAKIDCLIKMDVEALVHEGILRGTSGGETVDERSVMEIVRQAQEREEAISAGGKREDEDEKEEREKEERIKIFQFPQGWYGQEPTFVPRSSSSPPQSGKQEEEEDDGVLLCYVFDEAQLDRETGEAKPDAVSELWIIDARDMKTVVAKIRLPQRVPYGLHGTFYTRQEIEQQREPPQVRSWPLKDVAMKKKKKEEEERQGWRNSIARWMR